MKPVAILVSALATVAIAAPAAPATDLEARSFSFDPNALNNFSFQQVNLNYLNNINSLQISSLLNNLASVNNFNVLQFQSLFSQSSFDVQSLLQLQALQTFLQINQLGVLSGFDLSSLALQQLNLGLLNNVGVVDLQQFIAPSVVPQVQSIAAQVPVSFAPGVSAPSPSVGGDPSTATSAPSSDASSDVVTEAQQDAQEGSSSLN